MRLLKRIAAWGFTLATLLLAVATLLFAVALPVALAGYVFGLGFWLAFVSLPI